MSNCRWLSNIVRTFFKQKKLGKQIKLFIIPKRMIDDFWFDFDACSGHMFDDFLDFAKSTFPVNVICDNFVF